MKTGGEIWTKRSRMVLRTIAYFRRSDRIEGLGDLLICNRFYCTAHLTLLAGTFGVHAGVLIILISFNSLISILQLSEIDTVIYIPMGSQWELFVRGVYLKKFTGP